MTISESSICCSLQRALLGYVTQNLRAVNVECNSKLITIYFYYNQNPLSEEEEIAEVIATEVMTDFLETQVAVRKVTLPYPTSIPEVGLRVFHIYEDLDVV